VLGLLLLKYFHINSRGGAHFIPFTSGAIFKQIFLAIFFIKDIWLIALISSIFWIAILINTIISIQEHKQQELIFIYIFYLVGVLTIFIVELIAQNLGFASRYMLPSFIFPIIILVPFICQQINYYQLNTFLIIVLFILYPKIRPLLNKISFTQYYPDTVSCVDQSLKPYGIYNGIAQYWDARFYTMLTKNNLHVYAVDGSTLKQFEELSPTIIPQNYDFVLINTNPPDQLPAYLINQARLYKLNGRPIKTIQKCSNIQILIYPKNSIHLNKN
jgi:hypothetical protein